MPPHSQRNLILFATIVGLQYLAAPVIYVGLTQASLLHFLEANPIIANLPGASFFVMASLAALAAWAFPRVSQIKPVLVFCYGFDALTIALAALVLTLPVSNQLKIVVIVVQSGITGATILTAIAFLWEMLGRTTDKSKRGLALGLAYGAGPVLAAAGSLGSQVILAGEFELGPIRLEATPLESPQNYALLFALIAPVMGLASFLSSRLVFPKEKDSAKRRPVREIADLTLGIAAGVTAMVFAMQKLMAFSLACMLVSTVLFAIHFRDLLSIGLIRRVAVMTFILYVGNSIPSNMGLYSEEALGADPSQYAGYQNLLRFSFKALAGCALGWLLVKTSPRAGVLVTAALYVVALLWAMFATGKMYLIAFGIFGAGELIGVYAPNYMLSACRTDQMKRGMVMMNLIVGPVGQTGILFGWIATHVEQSKWSLFGQTPKAFGFQVSFATCGACLLVGIVLSLLFLPPSPKPSSEEQTPE